MNGYEEPPSPSPIIQGALDVHPTKCAIVFHYGIDARAMGADLKQIKKTINITNLTTGVNIHALARHLLSQNPLIQSDRVLELEQLLVYLRNRKKGKDILAASSKQIEKQLEDSQKEMKEEALMANIEEYLELLYESLSEKTRGTALVLQLSRNPDNLQGLSENESMFLALVRVLRDDWKKSIELSTNIIYIFFCFSTFSDYHPMLLHYKIGSLCMNVVDHELKRHETLAEDLEGKKKDVWAKKVPKQEYEKSKKKLSHILEKQESLLKVCLYLLLNISESSIVEQKMRNKGIIRQLIQLLSRNNQELLILVVSFLKKLSIYGVNKDDMAKEGVLPKLLKLIPCDNEIIINVTLRLLMNLSFDPLFREEMVSLGFLPKLVNLLNNEAQKMFALFTLYHISLDEKGRAAFAYTECVPMLMKFMLESDELAEPEVIGLAVNLSLQPITGQMMCRGPGLKLLMKKALQSREPVMMKLVHNLSRHKGDFKSLFLDYIGPLSELIRHCNDEVLLMEVLGVFSNLQIADLDYNRVLVELQLLEPLLKCFEIYQDNNDLITVLIMSFATFATDINCAQTLVDAGLAEILIDTLRVKQNNDGIVLQIANIFRFLLFNQKTSERILKSEAPDYFIELMTDKKAQIAKLSSVVVTCLATHSTEFSERVKAERFKSHNCQWLDLMTRNEAEDYYEDDEDYMDTYYLHMATELYSPEYVNESFPGGNPIGQNGRHPPVPHPLYTSPMVMDDGNLLMDELNLNYEEDEEDWYGPGGLGVGQLLGEEQLLGEDPLDYSNHPLFTMGHTPALQPNVLTARPPSKLQF